ncbi:30S ribosomal protein S27ae [Candidatus Pacearchaeota archaeon]|nr:30S ribosomal protein S27ae [Candidatus Pacearchaeota archaeon]
MAKKAKAKKKGKKPHKNKPTSKKYTKYKIEGDKVKRLARSCPRCGPGVFLMNSQGRLYCGKCHYAEFEGKKTVEEVKKEKVPAKKKE